MVEGWIEQTEGGGERVGVGLEATGGSQQGREERVRTCGGEGRGGIGGGGSKPSQR